MSVYDTPIDWPSLFVEWRRDFYRRLRERREQAARDTERQNVAETVVRRAMRRLSTTGTRFVSEGLLSVDERRALYDLSDAQMHDLEIGACERCHGRQFFDAGEMADMYDPRNRDQPSQMLHADCAYEGWNTA